MKDPRTFIMRMFILACLIPLIAFANPEEDPPPAPAAEVQPKEKAPTDSLMMVIPPGQIHGRHLKVFVPGKVITTDHKPVLTLTDLARKGTAIVRLEPSLTATGQVMEFTFEGTTLTRTGTVLMFDTDGVEVPYYYTCIRFQPKLTFRASPASAENRLEILYPDYYYLGHPLGTLIWTIVIFLALVAFIYFVLLAFKEASNPVLGLITDKDGKVSMALLQMLLWTLAVGLMVLAFGFMRLQVPDIPQTLILLMLFAGGTATVGQIQSKSKTGKDKKAAELELPVLQKQLAQATKDNDQVKTKQFQDKIDGILKQLEKKKELDQMGLMKKLGTAFYADMDSDYPSMAKAQVFCWTIITLILFIYLSFKEGQLWDVPEGLVALMGISQATFLGRQQIATNESGNRLKEAQSEKKAADASDAAPPPVPAPAVPLPADKAGKKKGGDKKKKKEN